MKQGKVIRRVTCVAVEGKAPTPRKKSRRNKTAEHEAYPPPSPSPMTTHDALRGGRTPHNSVARPRDASVESRVTRPRPQRVSSLMSDAPIRAQLRAKVAATVAGISCPVSEHTGSTTTAAREGTSDGIKTEAAHPSAAATSETVSRGRLNSRAPETGRPRNIQLAPYAAPGPNTTTRGTTVGVADADCASVETAADGLRMSSPRPCTPLEPCGRRADAMLWRWHHQRRRLRRMAASMASTLPLSKRALYTRRHRGMLALSRLTLGFVACPSPAAKLAVGARFETTACSSADSCNRQDSTWPSSAASFSSAATSSRAAGFIDRVPNTNPGVPL
eukprot:scaffold30546_cov34-Tisochrysis_lutea.AAC.1